MYHVTLFVINTHYITCISYVYIQHKTIYIYEIEDNRILSTNPRGASDPNVTWSPFIN